MNKDYLLELAFTRGLLAGAVVGIIVGGAVAWLAVVFLLLR